MKIEQGKYPLLESLAQSQPGTYSVQGVTSREGRLYVSLCYPESGEEVGVYELTPTQADSYGKQAEIVWLIQNGYPVFLGVRYHKDCTVTMLAWMDTAQGRRAWWNSTTAKAAAVKVVLAVVPDLDQAATAVGLPLVQKAG